MADNNYLEDDTENENDQEEKADTRGRTILVLLVAVGFLLVALSITGTLLAVKLMAPAPSTAAAASFAGLTSSAIEQAALVEPVEGVSTEETLTEQSAAQAEDKKPSKPKQPAIYYPIKPPLIVNFDARGRQRFLQVELALMTRDSEVISALDTHISMIRSGLILLIGGQLYEELQTAEGKELLRQQCLQEIQRLMEKEIGKPGVEQVLFTNFVMQ
jgi:flagellar FliL protein